MKKTLLLFAVIPLFTALAMPLKWTCNFPEASAEVFKIYQGESVTFEPSFKVNGSPQENIAIEGIYYQTNGMGHTWWKLEGNAFTPYDDIGAKSYRFFVAASSQKSETIYRANGTLIMLPSPGFKPKAADLPKEVFDFSGIEVLNAPWPLQSEVDDAVENSREAMSTVAALSSIVLGDDCQLVSTNYNSATKMPSLFLRFKIKDEATGEMVWYKVWDELTRWDYLFDNYLPTNYLTKAEVKAELEQKADRAWGYYDSTTGNYAPEGFTWISSPSIAIAGGLSYQRHLTTGGAVWVLESSGTTTVTGGGTNGYFRISDDKGNAIFEITKGTERVVGATAGAVQVQGAPGGLSRLFITYNVESASHPTLEITRDLANPDWKPESDTECIAAVHWTGSSGAWVAEVVSKSREEKLFVRGSYKAGARDIIKNSAPVSFTEIVIEDVAYKAKVETMNGKKVLVLE